MSVHRSKYGLILEILIQVEKGNGGEYELMKHANIHRHVLEKMVEPLISQGLLTKKKETIFTHYQITEKGILFRENLSRTLSLLYSKKSVGFI
jgi:predicted transcriptional regulator